MSPTTSTPTSQKIFVLPKQGCLNSSTVLNIFGSQDDQHVCLPRIFGCTEGRDASTAFAAGPQSGSLTGVTSHHPGMSRPPPSAPRQLSRAANPISLNRIAERSPRENIFRQPPSAARSPQPCPRPTAASASVCPPPGYASRVALSRAFAPFSHSPPRRLPPVTHAGSTVANLTDDPATKLLGRSVAAAGSRWYIFAG